MRLFVHHATRYRWSQAQHRIIQLLRVTPASFTGHAVVDWRIDVDCDARLRTGRDGYGNVTTMLYVDGPVDAIGITVRGEVLTEDMAGVVGRCAEPLPPLFFTRQTSLTAPDAAVAALARSVGSSDAMERAHALNAIVGSVIKISDGRTAGVPPGEVLARGTGNVRDAAHLLAAAAKACGIPARIVSGHSLHGPERDLRKTAHYWAELHLGTRGWVGFDPCSGESPDESYVRVAVGLEGPDVAPVSGTRKGGGIEELEAGVTVGQSQD
jgi:transglutaminase-like putative cysteine protease